MDLGSLGSRVRMTSRVDFLDDETIRFGSLLYAAGQAGRAANFAVRFDKLMMDDVVEPMTQDYIFDGRWLLDLDARDRQATRRELVAEGKQVDLEVGEGPFPLPLNLRADRLLERFNVELVPPMPSDPPPQSDPSSPGLRVPPPPRVLHLLLTPRPGVEFDGQQLDLWFDTAWALPLRAVTLQADGDTTTLDFFDLKPNAEVPADSFDTELPQQGEWERQTVYLD